VLSLDLPPEPTSATRARTVTRGYLQSSCPPEAIEVAALLVTELVTNAVLHARTPIIVVVESSPGAVFLAVNDGSRADPIARNYGVDAATGRGIKLVRELSTRWGVERSDAGKRVWCEITFPTSAKSAAVSSTGT
jgi:anti-sigma regulatory factor (Ser/Thr protein kinase)